MHVKNLITNFLLTIVLVVHGLQGLEAFPSFNEIPFHNCYSNCRYKSGSFLKMTKDNDELNFPKMYQLKNRNPFDVHVYYDGSVQRTEAIQLREKMQEKFTWMTFYALRDRPIGPHPVPMWEADFSSYENRYKWNDVKDFIVKEHGNLSVLIHPHSTDGDYADHTRNAFWVGEELDLRIKSWKRN